MVAETQHAPDPIVEMLGSELWAWSFLQAVRRIECLSPDQPRIGTSRHPSEDPIRFGQEPSLAFPPSSLADLVEGDPAAKLTVHFLGLLGPNGPMPLHFSEYVFHRLKHANDGTWAAFLDLFHHRMLSFFYRAWALHQQTVNFDRGDDPMGTYIASLFGLGIPSLRNRDALPDEVKLHFAGHLANPTGHAAGLRAVIEGDLDIPVEIQSFIGQWLLIPAESRCTMGANSRTNDLGNNTVVGTRIWDCVQRFRIRLGPLHRRDYDNLLPGSPGLRRVNAWVRNYAALELEWEVQLVLLAEEVRPISLGEDNSTRLGQTTWLLSKPCRQDADDLILGPFGMENFSES